MADRSVNEPAWVINQNRAEEALLKAEALLQIVLNSELRDVPPHILHDYLWTLNDLVSTTRKLM